MVFLVFFFFSFLFFFFLFCLFCLFYFIFETGSQVAQISLRLAVQPEDALEILIILPSPL